MPTTAPTKKAKSAFQAVEGFTNILVHRGGAVAPAADEKGSTDTRYVEYVNAERTIAVVGYSRDYAIAVKTGLTPKQVLPRGHYYLEDDYAAARERGVWIVIQDDIGSKTRARYAADAFLAEVQDVNDPLTVSLDGKFAPALTIALQVYEANVARYGYRSESRDDDTRRSALRDLAKEAGVNLDLLALAVKEDRLVWSTPPVAPKSVIVVVMETATGVLSERLVDEVTLAKGEVDGLGSIVYTGSVGEYLLARRETFQRHAIKEIIDRRISLEERLDALAERTKALQEELAKGNVVGRGMFDNLRMAEEAEKAQAAATAYAAATANADLPQEFVARLMKAGFATKDSRHSRWSGEEVRDAIKALAALNGMALKADDVW